MPDRCWTGVGAKWVLEVLEVLDGAGCCSVLLTLALLVIHVISNVIKFIKIDHY